MPKTNRVNPMGEIVASPHRGTLMGNRGLLHNADGHLRRLWQGKRWLICVLIFKGRRRSVMTRGCYTELFFLDEATALAAGHRPCAECRRERYNAFRTAWVAVHSQGSASLPGADEIDSRLHAERVGPDRTQRRFRAELADLPDGVFVRHDDWGDSAHLMWNDQLLTWTAGGYADRRDRPSRGVVEVLTPESTVAVIRAGYVPEVHPSA